MEKLIFNKEAALKNVMNSEEMLTELIGMFLTHNIDEENMQILCGAVRNYDIATIFRKTHNLKSTCIYAGADKLWEAIVELLEFSRETITNILKDAYQKLDTPWNNEISQREVDNATNMIELKKTIEPVSTVIEKNDQTLYEKYVYLIASEILNLINNGKLESIKPMTDKILLEAHAYTSEVKGLGLK
ncbi:MAG: hypothetical protein WCR55_00135 [Lentisphaerota bacterium]